MKKLNVVFEGTVDTTGYLFSLVKCLSASLRCGGYEEYANDIIAASGFAFRMWVDASLCPSATSIWEFKKQKPWIESGGLVCDYVERMWEENDVEEERRLHGIEIIKKSVDNGIAAVVWDISGSEWGLVTGYDDETKTLSTLKIFGDESEIPYDKLGQLDLPILSVLTVTGKTDKSNADIIADTKKLAASHLRGEEWCDNVKGIAAYDTLIDFVEDKMTSDTVWNLEYYLGTYAALKWYAWKFFEKYGEAELADIYKSVYRLWQNAFDFKKTNEDSILSEVTLKCITNFLREAKVLEEKSLALLEM